MKLAGEHPSHSMTLSASRGRAPLWAYSARAASDTFVAERVLQMPAAALLDALQVVAPAAPAVTTHDTLAVAEFAAGPAQIAAAMAPFAAILVASHPEESRAAVAVAAAEMSSNGDTRLVDVALAVCEQHSTVAFAAADAAPVAALGLGLQPADCLHCPPLVALAP
jgi:hypothetical protein